MFDTQTQEKLLVGVRLAAALVFVAALLFNVNRHWFWPGLAVSVPGLVLQLWSAGSVRSRKRLPVDGPYRFVRHPTYIAYFLYVLGLILMMGEPLVLAVFVPLYVFYAKNRIDLHEEALHDKFGFDYLTYARHVPLYLPRIRPYPDGRFLFFSGKNFRRQYGEILLVVSVLLYVSCYALAFHVY